MRNARRRLKIFAEVATFMLKRPNKFGLLLVIVLTILGMTARIVRAQEFKVWTDADFADLGKQCTEPLPVGTVINAKNWQKYECYFPIFWRTVFAGDHYYKWPDAPGFDIEVGPVHDVPPPKAFIAATEKYAGQTQLVQTNLAPGSWDVANYHGGYPFPNPTEPNKAYKILYNSWFSYRPAVVNERSFSLAIDKYKNQTTSSYNIVINQLNYNVDPGVPETNPVMPDYLNATYIELQSPEQSRYITSLNLKHKDPADFPDLYTFIPALRRVLRLSAAAVCADIQGSDVDNDDACPNLGVCPQIPIFKVELLGERKFLANIGMSHESVSPPEGKFVGYNPLYWHDTAADLELSNGIVLPKREAGKWEVRDVYVIRWQRLPEFQAGYCFGSRISYIDKQNFNSLGADNFDMQQKFYKAAVGDYQVIESPAGGPYFSADANLSYTIDFQNFHASNGGEFYPKFNADAGKFQDTTRYATPAGLQQVMQ
jgi:hypothetical protein